MKKSKGLSLEFDANQSRSLPLDGEGTNQTREVGLFLDSSNFQTMDRDNPFLSMGSNPAVSERQRRFMAMCAHDPSKARGKCPSKEVAREFSRRG